MRRLLIALSVVLVVFSCLPQTVQAQYDSRCFSRAQCISQRGFDPSEGDVKEFFYTEKDAQVACGVADNGGYMAGPKDADHTVGFCLAAGQATTKISFGGKRNFTDIGDFIKYGYQYGMWIAGILAVAVLVGAGFSWIVSGGNSDSISGAKKKIGGALTGLILLSLSYVILNTINPYLVELRLPKTWMINTAQIAAPFCSDVKDAKLAYLGPQGATISDEEKKLKLKEATLNGYNIDPQSLDATSAQTAPFCSHSYLVQNTNGQSCTGEICSEGSTCVPFTTANTSSGNQQSTIAASEVVRKSDCWSGQLVINYRVDSLFQNIINDLSGNKLGELDADHNSNDWFQDSTGDGQDTEILVYPVCQFTAAGLATYNSAKFTSVNSKTAQTFGEKPYVIDGGRHITPFSKIMKIVKSNAFDDYLTRYSFTPELIKDLKYACYEGSTNDPSNPGNVVLKKTVGIVIKNQINVSWSGYDALVYAYTDTNGNGTAKIWQRQTFDTTGISGTADFDYFFPAGYIPIENIDGTKKKGVYLDLAIPAETLNLLGSAITDSFSD